MAETRFDFAAFFASLSGMTPDEALASCVVESEWVKQEVAALHQQIGELPRSAKAEAKALALQAQEGTAYRKRLEGQRRHYQDFIDRRDRHSLWKEAVTAVCGPEALASVFAYMSAKRKGAA